MRSAFSARPRAKPALADEIFSPRSVEMSFDLSTEVLQHAHLADMDAAERRLALRALVVEKAPHDLRQAAELSDLIDGFGPLDEIMRDDEVTDILVNGPSDVWVEAGDGLVPSGVRFTDREQLMDLVHRWLASCGRSVDTAHPIADGKLADGSRIHVVLPPVAPGGPLVSIRRFRKSAATLERLVHLGLLDDECAERLLSWVHERKNIVVSGRTGCGKTTLIGALLAHVPPAERTVLVEETPELAPRSPHLVSLVTRPPGIEGSGGIDLSQLLRAALRMRPDRLIVGEVRGPEALIALTALSTGHEGSMLTVHSSSAGSTTGRLVTLALGAPGAPSEVTLDRIVEDAVDVVVHLRRRDGRRTIDAIHLLRG